jgi:hypothetical protein
MTGANLIDKNFEVNSFPLLESQTPSSITNPNPILRHRATGQEMATTLSATS